MSYEKQSFKNNYTILKAEALEHMEEGIYQNSVNIKRFSYPSTVKAVNHRGYSADAPENTIPAYILSAKKGFKYVECDVSFTSDGVAVLLHDSTIDRTSNGSGNVSNLLYAELYNYDFGAWYSSEYAGTKIATLKEFLVTCKGLGLHPYIELKSNGSYSAEQVTSVVDMVRAHGLCDNVTYISFNRTFLECVKTIDETARLGYIVDSITDTTIVDALNLETGKNEVFIDANYNNLTDAAVALCVDSGLPLEVWTVNSIETIESMNPYISGVTSDSVNASEVLHKQNLIYNVPKVPTTSSLDEDWRDGSAYLTPHLVAGGIGDTSPYINYSRTDRVTWVGSELTVNAGDVISVKVADGFRWGIQTLDTQNVENYNSGEYVTKVDSGWLTSDYTIPTGAVIMWITFSRLNNGNLTPADLGTVIITKS